MRQMPNPKLRIFTAHAHRIDYTTEEESPDKKFTEILQETRNNIVEKSSPYVTYTVLQTFADKNVTQLLECSTPVSCVLNGPKFRRQDLTVNSFLRESLSVSGNGVDIDIFGFGSYLYNKKLCLYQIKQIYQLFSHSTLH